MSFVSVESPHCEPTNLHVSNTNDELRQTFLISHRIWLDSLFWVEFKFKWLWQRRYYLNYVIMSFDLLFPCPSRAESRYMISDTQLQRHPIWLIFPPLGCKLLFPWFSNTCGILNRFVARVFSKLQSIRPLVISPWFQFTDSEKYEAMHASMTDFGYYNEQPVCLKKFPIAGFVPTKLWEKELHSVSSF